MLSLVTLSLMILIFTVSLHYSQHFRFKIRSCRRITSKSMLTVHTSQKNVDTHIHAMMNALRIRSDSHVAIRSTRQCCCILKAHDNETGFDFFPVSFLFYTIFIIFLCILIMVIDILNYTNSSHDETIIDLLFGYSTKTYNLPSFFDFEKTHLFTFSIPSMYVLDLCLILGIMILSLWESLFSFYRYWTTFKSAKLFREISAKQVIIRFILYYAIIYSIIFIAEIFIYYYTFVLVIMLHFSFNIICTWKFAKFLTDKYKLFAMMEDMDQNYRTNSNSQQILNSVIFMKYASIICCLLQSISLCIFEYAYAPTIVYYLPMIWSISCLIFALNFIRNRNFVTTKLFQCSQILKYQCKCCKTFKSVKTKRDIKLKTKPHFTDKKSKSKSIKASDLSEVILCDNDHSNGTDINNNTLKPPNKCSTAPQLPKLLEGVRSLPPVKSNTKTFSRLKNYKSDTDAFDNGNSEMNMQFETDEFEIEPSYSSHMHGKKTNKALELLGIQSSNSKNSHLVNLGLLQTETLKDFASGSKSKGDYVDVDMKTPDTQEVELDMKMMEHSKSNVTTIPIKDVHEVSPSHVDIQQAMDSFKLFAQYGFLSNTNINSAAQMRKYNVAMKKRRSAFFMNELRKENRPDEFGKSSSLQNRNKLPDMKNRWTATPINKNNSKKRVKFEMQ